MTREDGQGEAAPGARDGVVTPFPRAAAGREPQAPAASPRGDGPSALLLDITRSVKRVRHARPTGIDRVETAHAAHARALAEGGGRPLWLFAEIAGRGHVVPPDRAGCVLDGLAALGQGGADAEAAAAGSSAPGLDLPARLQPWRDEAWRRAEALIRRHARPAGLAARLGLPGARDGRALGAGLFSALPEGAAYLNVGHDALSRPLMAALADAGITRAVLLHDAIPVTHPEYSAPEAARRFRDRLDAAFAADLLIANSRATAASLEAIARASERDLPPIAVAPLGIDARPRATSGAAVAAEAGAPVRFVMLGTIEGRKNHLLMLALWRGLSDVAPGMAVPELHIVGRRGWAAGQVFEMLDRAPMMGWSVFEHGDLDDAAVARLFDGARALLFPSFVEGYGLPLGEALAAGLPVIAADLPALREVGGAVPDWLDPLDGPGWLAAIRDYAMPRSRRRAAQLERLAAWRPPSWEAHFAEVERALAEARARAARGPQSVWS